MNKKILVLGLVYLLIAIVFLSIIPAGAKADSEIEKFTYPTEVHREGFNTIKVDVINHGYYDEDYYLRVLLKYPDGSIVENDEGYMIKVGETDVFTVPARTRLSGNEVSISIPSSVPIGQYRFFVQLMIPGTAISEDDSTTDNTFTLLEKKEYQPYQPATGEEIVDALLYTCVIRIVVILIIFGAVFFKHRESLKTPEKLKEEKIRKHKALWKTQQYKETEQQSYLDKWREEMKKERIVSGDAVAEHVCPVCGAGLSEFALFCPNCRTKLTEERWRQSQKPPYQSEQETPVEREPEPVTFEPTEKPELIKIRCPVCKHEMEIEDTGRPLKIMCKKCGVKGTLK